MPRHVVVGTAGHVDHGKSSLVRALTGTDPDRLKEEQERGITIDLGFAHVPEREGLILSFVDVPGHERFVRNMLAGAVGIDVVLLVVAADESVMPQTREHLDICRLLGVSSGVVAVTKSDLVDADTLELVRLEIGEILAAGPLASAPLVACSSTTRAGLAELLSAIHAAAARTTRRSDAGALRLPVDRAFTLKGFGTVVTGTAVSGRVAAGDEVELMPSGRRLRVRSVQVHGSSSQEGVAGQRVALNLGGIEHREIERGDVVVSAGSHVATSILDVQVDLLPGAPELDDLARVRLHLGTAEVMARLRWAGDAAMPGASGVGQLRLEAPIVATVGDRFILRRYSPMTTIGGGRVLHAAPLRKIRPSDASAAPTLREAARLLAAGGVAAVLPGLVSSVSGAVGGVAETELAAWTGLRVEDVREAMGAAESAGGACRVGESPRRWLSRAEMDAALDRTCARLAELHRAQPLATGHPRPALRSASGLPDEAFAALVEQGVRSGKFRLAKDLLCLADHSVTLTEDERRSLDLLVAAHRDKGLQPPDLDAVVATLPIPKERARRLVRLLLQSGDLVQLKEGMLVHGAAMAAFLEGMASWYSPGQPFSVPDFKERSGTSRKHAIPLLEYLDSQGLARRVGEGRIWTGPARNAVPHPSPME